MSNTMLLVGAAIVGAYLLFGKRVQKTPSGGSSGSSGSGGSGTLLVAASPLLPPRESAGSSPVKGTASDSNATLDDLVRFHTDRIKAEMLAKISAYDDLKKHAEHASRAAELADPKGDGAGAVSGASNP